MSHNHRKKSPLKGILLIFAIVASGAFWGFTLYSDYDIYEGSYGIPAADHVNITNIEFHYNVEVGSVDIEILNTSADYIMESNWKHLFGAWGVSDVEPIELEFENYTVGNTLVIIATSTGDVNSYNAYNGMNVWEFDIALNPNYIYNFSTQGSVASIDILAQNTVFNGINLAQNTGSANLELHNVNVTSGITAEIDTGSIQIMMDNSSVDGTIEIETGTGYIEFDLSESTTGAISAITDTGSIYIDLYDTAVLGELNAQTGTGYIEFNIYESTTGALHATTDTGSIDINLSETEVLGELDFQTGTGSVEVDIYELIYNTTQMISLDTDTGSVEFYLYQSNLPYSITIDLSTGTGYINADFYTPEGQESQLNVSATAGTGHSDIEYHHL